MSLESFVGFDTGEGMSEAAFEKFKEKMAQAAAQIAAIKKEEKKQKKKEEDLLKILLKFVKSSKNRELTLLISRVLEQNIPANFILAIIILSHKEIRKELGSFSVLGKGEEVGTQLQGGTPAPETEEQAEKSLIFFQEDQTLPLKIKIELDNWLKGLLFQAEETPQKLLKTAYDIEFIEKDEGKQEEKKTIKRILIQLITFIIREFLEQNKINEPYKKLFKFSEFITKGILDKTRENLENRKMIGEIRERV